MDDYISRDDALLHSEIIRVYSKDYGNIDVVPVEYLADIPAADVQPVKHGHWEEEDTMPYDNFVVCSECGMNLSYQNYTKEEWQESFRYCPCCGARMDGDSE